VSGAADPAVVAPEAALEPLEVAAPGFLPDEDALSADVAVAVGGVPASRASNELSGCRTQEGVLGSPVAPLEAAAVAAPAAVLPQILAEPTPEAKP
jgi:hypothetical protein